MISERIADFIQGCTYAQLPEPVRYASKLFLLDWLGSAIRGSVEPPARIFAEIAKAEGGNRLATALPERRKTSVSWAAQINAAASHTVEMDDLHPSSVFHPASPVISAAVALGEALDASGADLLAAIAAGYEVGIRAGQAAGPTHYSIWHTTATCGTFGAAAAAASLLKLDRERIVWALGSAGTQAAGLWQFLEDGAMSKQLHTAHAASAGILAAELASRRFTAARAIFEGKKAFLSATSKAPEPAHLTECLGEEFRSLTNSFKKHASCRHTHSAIDAALLLRGRAVTFSSVLVEIYPAGYALLNGVTPDTPYAAKFSLPYTVAAALVRGRVGLQEFEDVQAPDIRRVMPVISVASVDALGAEYPAKWPARLTGVLPNGERLVETVEYPKGDSQNPMSLDELEEKFRGLTEGLMPPEDQRRVTAAIRRIDSLKVKDIWSPPA